MPWQLNDMNPYAFTQQSRGVSTQHTRVHGFSGSRLGSDGYSGSFYRLTPAADSLKKQCLDRLRHSLYELSVKNVSQLFEKVNIGILTIFCQSRFDILVK